MTPRPPYAVRCSAVAGEADHHRLRPVLAAGCLLLFTALAEAQVTPAAPDIWPDHAIDDDTAAQAGRQAMPFTQQQILQLGRLLQQTLAATAEGGGDIPEGRQRRLELHPGEIAAPPQVALARGYTTALVFTDVTGSPWPIEEILVDRQFLPADANAASRPDGGRHLLYLSPLRRNAHGNALVKLEGLVEPLPLLLVTGGPVTDHRIDLRLALPGPLADPAALVSRPAFQAGDAVLLDLLAGAPPPDAVRLVVEGGGARDRAWAIEDGILLVTRALALSPGPWSAERSSDGRWAYRLPATPFALLSADGEEVRLAFRAEPALTTVGTGP